MFGYYRDYYFGGGVRPLAACCKVVVTSME